MVSKNTKRKRQAQVDKSVKLTKTPFLPISADVVPATQDIFSLLSTEELECTIETLQLLTQHTALIKSKACRDIRVAVYDFRQACTVGANAAGEAEVGLSARISGALADGKYTDALVLLAEMRIRGEKPKLGALCRWVRDLDVVSGLSMQSGGVSHAQLPRSKRDKELLRVLDAILRVTGTEDLTAAVVVDKDDPICLQPEWNTASSSKSSSSSQTISAASPGIKDMFDLIESTEGQDRKPPNVHPALLFLSKPNTIRLDRNPAEITKLAHPSVPNLSVIQNVLSHDECSSIVAACEAVGFTPDAPLRDDGQEASVLAHNVYWIIDQPFHDALYERIRPHVPAFVGGKRLRGINRRFRVYRYVPGAEYRCHIDGAWPPSGIDTSEGRPKYVYDSSPVSKRQSSLFTFLVYLNDGFTAGETTFFMPSARHGVMNAYPVRPVMGSVAVFPHGEAAGALLHEGTGVSSGTKYIIRTDVEYDVDPTEEKEPLIDSVDDARIEEDA